MSLSLPPPPLFSSSLLNFTVDLVDLEETVYHCQQQQQHLISLVCTYLLAHSFIHALYVVVTASFPSTLAYFFLFFFFIIISFLVLSIDFVEVAWSRLAANKIDVSAAAAAAAVGQ